MASRRLYKNCYLGEDALQKLLFRRGGPTFSFIFHPEDATKLETVLPPLILRDATKLDLNFVPDLWRGSTLKSLLQDILRSFCS